MLQSLYKMSKSNPENTNQTMFIECDGNLIAKTFYQKVLSHILRVHMNLPPSFKSSLILAIQGPPGYGKSFQTRAILNHSRIKYVSIDSASLSGKYEGDSIKRISEQYYELGMSDAISTIIIDDFDISIAAHKENTERTSNSDILNSLLMHLCDNPTEIGGRTGIKATPIIMTGNNFSNIYKPLIRNGRADLFNWIPSTHEKKHIINRILSHIKITEREMDIVFDKYKDKNIAFFSQVKSHLVDDSIISVFDRINKYGSPSRSLLNSEFREEAISSIKNASLDKIMRICESLDVSTNDYVGK